MNDLKAIDLSLTYLKRAHPFLYNMRQYHRTHLNKPIRFYKRWYLAEIYKDVNTYMVLKKATQNGISEYLIGRSIDEASKSRNVLYILPNEVIRTRFISARFDRTIENSAYYKKMLNNMNSIMLKKFNDGIINFIGSNASAGFTEFVAHTIIIDEMDRCYQANLPMADERQASIVDKLKIIVSNPTVLNYGIDYEFNKSDKKQWFIECPCGHKFVPDFFINVVKQIEENDYMILDTEWERESSRDIYLICEKCGKPVDRFQNGEWVGSNKADISGYHISKLFSTEVTLKEMVERFNEGLVKDIVLQRFYNGDLGLAFNAKGAKITEEMLDACRRDYNLQDMCKEPCLMGVDVGTELNVIIGKILPDNKIQLIYINTVRDEKDIFDLLKRFNIIIGVIDIAPERRISERIARSYKSMWMCDYKPTDNIKPNDKIIVVNRTVTLDGIKEGVLLQNYILPKNARSISGFYKQVVSSVRFFNEDRNAYVWVESGPDHYHHAWNYLGIAKSLLASAK